MNTVTIQFKISKYLKPISSLICALFLVLTVMDNSVAKVAERDSITMYLGEVQVLQMGLINRVAIGNPSVASNSILPQGQLVILGDAVGVTIMHIWLKNGQEKDLEITVLEKKALDSFQEISSLLLNIKGVKTEQIGDIIVVKGTLASQDNEMFQRIIGRYKGVLNLVTPENNYKEIESLLQNIPGLYIRKVGKNAVISGEVSAEYDKLIQVVLAKYPDLVNLVRTKKAIAGKMVYMKVKIMEIKKSVTEKLGINWNSTGIWGPSFDFGVEIVRDGASILSGPNTSKALKDTGKTNLTSASGYFGIATGLFSTINLLESNGDAVLLAEPRLSARSGGKAEFLSGGEFPTPVTSNLGQTNVEFKKHGVMLKIAPVVDDLDNILAHIETEISTIDTAVTIEGIPGLLSRKTSTDISIRAGETLVISGLLNEEAGKSSDNVKWLSSLPILGPLFQSKEFKNHKSELVIFVTPYIYDASSNINRVNLRKIEVVQRHFDEIVKGNELILD